MLDVCLCKPAIYNLKFWVGEPQKGGNKIFKVEWGEAKEEEHDF